MHGEDDADHFPLLVQHIDNHADDRFPFETAPDPPMTPDPPTTPDQAAGWSDAALTAAHEQFGRVSGLAR